MTQQLITGLTYAGRYFPEGTVITPKGEPGSGGYFFAMAELAGRSFLVSVRDTDVTTIEDETEQVVTQLITDVNEFEISQGDRVEYLGMDDFGGSLGKVDAIEVDGTVYVEFDCDEGNAWACRPVLLAVVHVEPCATCMLTGAGA